MKYYGRVTLAVAVVTALTGAVLVAGTAASAAPHAALVSVTNGATPTVHFQAGTGTVNEVYVYPVAGGIHVEDVVGTIQLHASAKGPCVQVTEHIVMCSSTMKRVDVTLSDGNDYYNNTSALPSTADGGDGDDSLLGGTATDTFHGGPGKDTLYGGYGNDVLEGDAGRDTVFGQAGDDTVNSADGDDDLWGSSGNDKLVASRTVHGDDGNDLITMTRNTGDIWGGTESDRVDYSSWGVDVYVSLDGNDNDGTEGSACDDLFGCPVAQRHNVHGDIEKITGSAHNDRLIGNDNDNQFDGGAGNDRIDGRGGDDYLDAEGGSGQKVHGGGGDDTCVGFGLVVRDGCEH
jgi:Ca2+-binding RTX toxin-like protein